MQPNAPYWRQTDRLIVEVPFPSAAVIWVGPLPVPVTRPLASIVATAVLLELQVAVEVISWLVPSEYTSLALNCLDEPVRMVGLGKQV